MLILLFEGNLIYIDTLQDSHRLDLGKANRLKVWTRGLKWPKWSWLSRIQRRTFPFVLFFWSLFQFWTAFISFGGPMVYELSVKSQNSYSVQPQLFAFGSFLSLKFSFLDRSPLRIALIISHWILELSLSKVSFDLEKVSPWIVLTPNVLFTLETIFPRTHTDRNFNSDMKTSKKIEYRTFSSLLHFLLAPENHQVILPKLTPFCR